MFLVFLTNEKTVNQLLTWLFSNVNHFIFCTLICKKTLTFVVLGDKIKIKPMAITILQPQGEYVMSNEEALSIVDTRDPIMERKECVAAVRNHNEAVAYLRKQDCAMLTTLRDHLGENIRLHNVLARINDEIARLKNLLKTPKPKFKIALVLVGIVVAIAGMMLSSDKSKAGYYGSLAIGVALIILAIVLKVLGDKKWKKFIEDVQAKITIQKEKAANAQKDIDDYWENHALPYIASIIPDRFPVAHVLDYNTVCGMLYVMDNLRADTIKEAINLYDELCFRSSMRASFKSMESSLYETARNSARYAAAAERSAEANERAAASAALTAASAASIASSASRMASSTSAMASDVSRAASASVDASNAVRDAANRY